MAEFVPGMSAGASRVAGVRKERAMAERVTAEGA
jgi:hypothetical protein